MAEGGYPWADKQFALPDDAVVEIEKMTEIDEPVQETEITEPVQKEDNTESDSSSQVSSESDESEDEDPDDSEWCDPEYWPTPFTSKGGNKWHLQLLLADEGSIPYCRSSPFKSYIHQDKNEILDMIAKKEICIHCWRRSPKACRSAMMNMIALATGELICKAASP